MAEGTKQQNHKTAEGTKQQKAQNGRSYKWHHHPDDCAPSSFKSREVPRTAELPVPGREMELTTSW
jgi:hypothetical protein